MMDERMRINIWRVKSGIFFDTNFNPFSKKYLEDMLEICITIEDYELCTVIREHIKSRFL